MADELNGEPCNSSPCDSLVMASSHPNEICLLCEEPMETGSDKKKSKVVKIAGINTLIRSSKAKGAKLHLKLKGLKEIKLHDSCRSQYNRLPSADSKPQLEKDLSLPPSAKPSTRAQKVEEFSFSTLCLFRGCDAGSDFEKKENKKELHRRRKVSLIINSNTREFILQSCNDRGDYDASLVRTRIESVSDLVTVASRYHSDCYQKFTKHRSADQQGRPLDPTLIRVVEFIIQYVTEHDDDNQFSMRDLIEESGEKVSDLRTVQEKLKDFFRERIIFTPIKNDSIITYLERSRALFTDSWLKKARDGDNQERKKIILGAAEFVLDDIKRMVYDTTYYRAPSYFLDQVLSDIPPSLKLFLDTVMKGKKQDSEKWETRVRTASHMIISSARPRSFISSVQLGLSSMLHSQHASRKLIDNLSFVGVCASYTETLLYQASLIKYPESYSIEKAYIKCVFDNADQNKKTEDGYGTFHVLGGIKIVIPGSSVTSQEQIPRLKQLPKAAELGKAGVMELRKYHSAMTDGLKNVIMKVVSHSKDENPLSLVNPRNLTWFYGKGHRPLETKGWNAFMEMVSDLQEYETARILSLPIVNNPPNELDTIYTALLYADNEARKHGQKHIFCTFDHPLFMKSEYVLENQDPEKPKLRCLSAIGIFHLLMSTSNAISSTMDGSGLKEVLGLVFAENSLEAILSGKAHDRAMRGHKLVHNAISTLVFREVELSLDEESAINGFLTDMEKPDVDIIRILDSDEMKSITRKFLDTCELLGKRSPTAKLWIQYLSLVILMFKIVEAVKKGDWNLFLDSLKHTLPLFHATAHLNYAKGTHLYLQKMLALEEIMDPIEYDTYTKKQCWVVRRRDIFFSGNPDDLTIEQVFMRTMKTAGGFTHGRGTTDSVIARWIMSMIVLADVTYAMESFCNYGHAGSEQFSDDRKSSIKRDARDLEKILQYFSMHNPFDETDTESVISLSTGLRGDDRVNCQHVFEIGNSLLSGTFGKKFQDIKLQRKTRVVSLAAAQSSIALDDGDVVRIDPTLLFQRLSMIIEKKEDMIGHLKLELAPYPKALFDQNGMGKTQKHKFIENFAPLPGRPTSPGMKYVIDGGLLLHKIGWSRDEMIDDILDKYVKYVEDHFPPHCTIVFDGYPDIPEARHIKSLERARRIKQNQARELKFERGMKIPLSKEKFLSNEKNKNRLIALLMQDLIAVGHECEQAEEDADILIVKSAINLARELGTPTMIVGEDIDLLVILTQLAAKDDEIYFFKPRKGKTPNSYFSCNSFRPESLTHIVAFLHAFCGCDTISAIFGKGKNTIVKLFQNKIDLILLAESFNKSDTPVQILIENGIKVMARLYEPGGESDDLDDMRYRLFRSKSTKTSFKLEDLPPTRKATIQHILRTYLQVQIWLGNETIKAKDFGWFETKTSANVRCLKPVYVGDNILIPLKLMEQISCGCKKGCKTRQCSCVKVGVPCTDLCRGCHGTLCNNIPDFVVEVPTDDPNVDEEAGIILNSPEFHGATLSEIDERELNS